MLLEQTGKSLADAGQVNGAALFMGQANVAAGQARLLRETVLSSERFNVDSLLHKAEKNNTSSDD